MRLRTRATGDQRTLLDHRRQPVPHRPRRQRPRGRPRDRPRRPPTADGIPGSRSVSRRRDARPAGHSARSPASRSRASNVSSSTRSDVLARPTSSVSRSANAASTARSSSSSGSTSSSAPGDIDRRSLFTPRRVRGAVWRVSGGIPRRPVATGPTAADRAPAAPPGPRGSAARAGSSCARAASGSAAPRRRRGRRPSRAGARGRRRGGGGRRARSSPSSVASRSSPAAGRCTIATRDRVVERDHRVRREALEQLVEREDLRPVGLLGARGLGVDGGDRRLQLVRPDRRRAPASSVISATPSRDRAASHRAPVLLGERDQRAVRPRCAPGAARR